MINFILFVSTILIWGTSWIAISWQIGAVDVVVSVFYRFALACPIMLIGLGLMGRLHFPKQWRFVILQALCLFSFNFLCFYQAAALIPSGLVSVIFSLATIFNAVNARIFYNEVISIRTVFAGCIGALGVVLLFWYDFSVSFNLHMFQGIVWAVGGTVLFSLGNMMSRKNSLHGVSPLIANGWGMGIGAFILAMVALFSNSIFSAPTSTIYIGALIYLAVFGSVIGFTTYLLLVARIGSDRASLHYGSFPYYCISYVNIF